MPDQRRTLIDWYDFITECRQSGLSDAKWCYQKGINRHALNATIKRLRRKAVAIPSPGSIDIDHLPLIRKEVVQVNILPDVTVSPSEIPSSVPPHFDNSHTIKIIYLDATIEVCNDADPICFPRCFTC